MVSPSKIQHQEQEHPPTDNKLDYWQFQLQKGRKPLQKKSFYLDIKNHATASKIEAKIKDLGGTSELFLVRSVSVVVSDRVDKAGYVNQEKRKWGCVSGGSGGPPSLRSLESQTPMQTPPTSLFSSECPLSNSTNLRGQTAQRSKSRVDAMLERALIQPQQCSVDPLDNAQSWGIQIWAIDRLQTVLDKIYEALKEQNSQQSLKHPSQRSSINNLKVRHLKGPYIKFESFHRNTRPVSFELPEWPTFNFSGEPGSCPFNLKKREDLSKSVKKEVKENREVTRSIKKEEAKEMTRRPRTTATRTRRTEQLASGYCEICRVAYRDLSKHVQSEQHLSFVRNDDNFLSLDTLINAGANVEAFLKLNKTKDIEKDCNFFPNGDTNLHNVVLPDSKVSTNSKGLEEFGVEDIKMVECNGARRNLSLKLNPPHNLRVRNKHESGHLLRSKGSPWLEVDKVEKFYDKFEGFTIKKRAKGTIWIEEDEPGDDFVQQLKESKNEEFKIKTFSNVIEGNCEGEKEGRLACNKRITPDLCNRELQRPVIRNSERNGISTVDCIKQGQQSVKYYDQLNGDDKNGCAENNSLSVADNINIDSCKLSRDVALKELNCELQSENVLLPTKELLEGCDRLKTDIISNGQAAKDEQKPFKTGMEKNQTKDDRTKFGRFSRRGGRSIRGRQRLSVEERLIEDNRAYYKVEVLGSKLRSSVLPTNNLQSCSASKDRDGDVEKKEEEEEEVPSSAKPVVVRFKRVRKSELSLLSDEAESFMFGEPRRDDSSEISDGDQSSVLPKDTESECNDTANSVSLSSVINSSSPVKSEIMEEDSQDSTCLGRARKRRRTQAEALIKDNADYYKFETPGSRLRYQAPITGIKDLPAMLEHEKPRENDSKDSNDPAVADVVEKMYPSKPSPVVEKLQFSFEAVPKSEPWYQTYHRQDEGAEFWHYFSEGDSRKPFLLPYEIDNFHEILCRNQNRVDARRKGGGGRGRFGGCGGGRSPRKSPRCHASTLAIMSTIIKKKEQLQQQSSNLYAIEEASPQVARSQSNNAPPSVEVKQEPKSDVDEELKEMVKTIDEMLNLQEEESLEMDDWFEVDAPRYGGTLDESSLIKGPPTNLVELLENCNEIANCLENLSCASSECGEGNVESPLKRRKKRKNRTGWPGIKMKKKLHSKPTIDTDGGDRDTLDATGHCEEKFGDPIRQLEEDDADRISTLDQENFNLRIGDDGYLLDNCTAKTTVSVDREDKRQHQPSMAESIDCPTLRSTNSVESCAHSTMPELCVETEKSFVLKKECDFAPELAEIEEMSENDPSNDENHENVFRKDVNSITERRFISKTPIKKRPRENTSSDRCEAHVELENQDILRRKDTEPRRKHHNNGLSSTKRQRKGHSDNPESELERHNSVYRRNRVSARKRIYSRKRAKKNNISSNTVYEDENCKKDTYLSITCRKQQNIKKGRADGISSEQQDSDLECALTERVSPTIITTSELEQRRSSIDYQPVVRMMKIDDQVDMDHSILSVTVASNRRLRSSSSPRSNAQPPKKRLKSSRAQFGRWLKNS